MRSDVSKHVIAAVQKATAKHGKHIKAVTANAIPGADVEALGFADFVIYDEVAPMPEHVWLGMDFGTAEDCVAVMGDVRSGKVMAVVEAVRYDRDLWTRHLARLCAELNVPKIRYRMETVNMPTEDVKPMSLDQFRRMRDAVEKRAIDFPTDYSLRESIIRGKHKEHAPILKVHEGGMNRKARRAQQAQDRRRDSK